MIYEGVNFFEEAIGKMTKEEFVTGHLHDFWLDREERVRRKMLSDVYGLIVKPKKKAYK